MAISSTDPRWDQIRAALADPTLQAMLDSLKAGLTPAQPQPSQPQANGQVYISAPATGAIALISAVLGAGAGYMVGNSKHKALKAKAVKEEPQEEGSEEE